MLMYVYRAQPKQPAMYVTGTQGARRASNFFVFRSVGGCGVCHGAVGAVARGWGEGEGVILAVDEGSMRLTPVAAMRSYSARMRSLVRYVPYLASSLRLTIGKVSGM